MRYSICLFCAFSLSLPRTHCISTTVRDKASRNPQASDMNGEYFEYNLFSLVSPPPNKQFQPTTHSNSL